MAISAALTQICGDLQDREVCEAGMMEKLIPLTGSRQLDMWPTGECEPGTGKVSGKHTEWVW